MFFKGIVFTTTDKDKALGAFLNHCTLKFKKVIFIDDQQKNLESVEKITAKRHIPFVGIEYTAAKMHAEPLNTKRGAPFRCYKKTKNELLILRRISC